MTSINTNIYAMQALFGLDRANQQLGVAQKRVNTGYRVNDANDDGATFAIAQSVRGNINAYDAVIEGLNRSKGELGKARMLFEQLGELVNQAVPLLVKLADSSLDAQSRQRYSDEVNNLIHSNDNNSVLSRLLDETTFMGQSIGRLDAVTAIDIGISNIRGDKLQFTVANEAPFPGWGADGELRFDLNEANSIFENLGTAIISAGLAQQALSNHNQNKPITNLAVAFARFERRVDGLIAMNQTLRDAAEIGLGAMVDADLARESAKLQSAQIKQQMAIQSLGLANNSNRNVLALFGRFA